MPKKTEALDINRLVRQWRERESWALKELNRLKPKTVLRTTDRVEAHQKTEGENNYMKTVQLPYDTDLEVKIGPQMNEGGILDVICTDTESGTEYLIDVLELAGRALLP